jgi:uncharacterized membrane protein
MYEAIVTLHVVGAVAFLAAHAVSMYASFRVRGERDGVRAARLLGRSGQSIGIMYIGLAALLIAGIVAAFMGDHWGAGWLWASIGVLVAVIGVMYSVAAPFYQRIRQAAGPDGAVAPDDLERLATSSRPWILASVGGIGFVAVVWLMLAKPF